MLTHEQLAQFDFQNGRFFKDGFKRVYKNACLQHSLHVLALNLKQSITTLSKSNNSLITCHTWCLRSQSCPESRFLCHCCFKKLGTDTNERTTESRCTSYHGFEKCMIAKPTDILDYIYENKNVLFCSSCEEFMGNLY